MKINQDLVIFIIRRFLKFYKMDSMNIEARKQRLIRIFSRVDDTRLIGQLEAILLKKEENLTSKTPIIDILSGAWSNEEAEDIKRVIAEGCEKFDENEW